MKILHILDHSLPIHDGYALRSMNIFRAQHEMGITPVILTSSKHEKYWMGEIQELELIEGFSFYRTGSISSKGLPTEPEIRLMAALYRRILEVAEIENPDLIHSHSPILNTLPAIWAARKLCLPLVHEIRAFWEDAGVDQGTYKYGSLKYRLVRYLETWACRKANHVAVLCNGIKNDLVGRGIPLWKITPVFNGINPEDFKPRLPDEELLTRWNLSGKKVIGFIGSFYHYEGLDLLIKAFSLLNKSNPQAVLLLIGSGEMESELKAQIQRLDLSERIIMPGQISHERIAGVYALIDIFAYPRYSIRLTELVTPLKPLEAMAMGKPLVASDVGGHKELIRDNENGVFFTAGDADSLAAKLELLLTNEILCQSLVANSTAWVKNFHTWQKTAGVYPAIYSSATNA